MISRRTLLRSALGTALLAGGVHTLRARNRHRVTTNLRLGGPVFVDSDDPAVLARAHRDNGYRAAYAPNVTLSEQDRLEAIRREFSARDVVIAEVGAWVNMLDPDSEKRLENVGYVTERLALAEELGARCCVAPAGSYHPDIWYGPHPNNLSQDFFEATVENVRRVIDAVNPRRTKFTIHLMPWSLPTGPEEYLKLIRAVERPSFAVHMDVCMVINSPYRMYNNRAVIRECFEKLGQWIVSCHAKDLDWVIQEVIPGWGWGIQEVIPGRGKIDYHTYLAELAKLPVDAPLMLEHLDAAEEYAEGRSHIQKVAGELGLSFDG